jgi:polyferredoxin
MKIRKLVILRRASQAFFLAGFVYVLWSTTYPLEGKMNPELFFKADPLIMFFTALSGRVVLEGMWMPLAALALALVFGRYYCGWICPLGTCIDCAGALRPAGRPAGYSARGRNIKYGILSALFISAVFGAQLVWPFDPMVIAARFISLDLIPAFTFVLERSLEAALQGFKIYSGPVYDVYTGLENGLLGVNIRFFSISGAAILIFAAICAASLFLPRLWCRAICPLGGLYSLAAKLACISRKTRGCSGCGACVRNCRMGAIKNGTDHNKGECVLCMDCVYDCPGAYVHFGAVQRAPKKRKDPDVGGISRKNFLFLLISSAALAGGAFRREKRSGKSAGDGVIRPPAALAEEEFVDRCVRCGNCMKVCITNGLQPVFLESGAGGIWTPRLVPEIGCCEYNCVLCGGVCPTGAIKKIDAAEKHLTKLGAAEVHKDICIAWKDKKECIVCHEYCPVSEKALDLIPENVNGKIIYKPVVNDRCVGCGACQNKCPVRPERAIRVKPLTGEK